MADIPSFDFRFEKALIVNFVVQGVPEKSVIHAILHNFFWLKMGCVRKVINREPEKKFGTGCPKIRAFFGTPCTQKSHQSKLMLFFDTESKNIIFMVIGLKGSKIVH